MVVVGFGMAGRQVAALLASCKIPYLILELNAETVWEARQTGLPVYYGDATSQEALQHAHLPQAKGLVLLMNDLQASRRVIDVARRIAPQVPILMRVHYLRDRSELLSLGVNEVVTEEIEGSIEVVSRILHGCGLPADVINAQLSQARQRLLSIS